MLPIRDINRSRNFPFANVLLIGLNVLLYLVQLAQGEALEDFIILYGLVPARYTVSEIAARFSAGQQLLALFSFMFLHGGFLHLLGNMWSLYIFGDNVEDRMGPVRYLLFYLLCGWASGLFHLLLSQGSMVPTIGASGAIAGVMGAYLVLFPRSKILTFLPVLFIPYFIEVPAFFFLGIWFILQFLGAAGSSAGAPGIAWWAHVGGFVSGILMLKLLFLVPEMGITRALRPSTQRTKTPNIQVLRTTGTPDDRNLYGTIHITPRESLFGTKKLVNIPWGFHSRSFRVDIPSGVSEGTVLRLAGMGRQLGAEKGDLLLRVSLRS